METGKERGIECVCEREREWEIEREREGGSKWEIERERVGGKEREMVSLHLVMESKQFVRSVIAFGFRWEIEMYAVTYPCLISRYVAKCSAHKFSYNFSLFQHFHHGN